MSKLVIRDLAFLTEIDSQDLNMTGGAVSTSGGSASRYGAATTSAAGTYGKARSIAGFDYYGDPKVLSEVKEYRPKFRFPW